MSVSVTAVGLVATVRSTSYSHTTICPNPSSNPNPNPNLYYIKGWCLLLSDCIGLLDLLIYIIFTGLN